MFFPEQEVGVPTPRDLLIFMYRVSTTGQAAGSHRPLNYTYLINTLEIEAMREANALVRSRRP